MQYMLDIISSMMVAGIITLIVIQLNVSMTQESIQIRYEWATQENMSKMAEILENDFYKIGSHATAPPLFISTADSEKIVFRGDVDTTNLPKGSIEDVSYYSVKSSIAGDKRTFFKLYRKIGSTAGSEVNLGFTKFKLSYYDSLAKMIPWNVIGTKLGNIRSIKVKMQMESPLVFTDDTTRKAAASYWEKFISPKNLRPVARR